MPGIAIKPAGPRAARVRRRSAASVAPIRRSARVALLQLSLEARIVWGAVLAFVGASLAWLTSDHRIPDWDSGIHELLAVSVHNELAAGRLSAPFTDYNSYPPLVHLVGGLTAFLTGAHPMALILSSNVVFVPLLAFGCYGTAKLAFGRTAGAARRAARARQPDGHLDDAPVPARRAQAALVAVAVWALVCLAGASRDDAHGRARRRGGGARAAHQGDLGGLPRRPGRRDRAARPLKPPGSARVRRDLLRAGGTVVRLPRW